jgi:hypothetical protein
MDVGCILRGFGGPSNRWNDKNTNQKPVLASKMPTASLRVDPYGHPQHTKVQKNFVYNVWMWDAVLMGVGGPTNRQNIMNIHQKTILASETRKKS